MPSYADLLADIPNWLEDQSAEIAGSSERFAQLAILRMSRELKIAQFQRTILVPLIQGDQNLVRPADLSSILSIYIILPGGIRRALQERNITYVNEFTPDPASQGVPRYYAELDGQNFRLGPVPDAAYNVEVNYRAYQPFLTLANPNTYITDYLYDALLFATLAEAARFAQDNRSADLIAKYEARYAGAVAAINGVQIQTETDEFTGQVRMPQEN